MNKAIWLLIVFFCAGFISCKSKMEGIELYFVDADGAEITETSFEIRPYIIWQPAYKDKDGGGYSLDSMSQAETFYNWFSVKIIIKNNSDEDIVLNKVEDKARYYGSYGGSVSTSGNTNSGCDYESSDCQMCFPRTIGSGVEESLEFRDLPCRYHSEEDDARYQAARITYEIEVISAVYGTLTKAATLFATPKTESDDTSYGALLCDDGKATCKLSWEWNQNDLPNPADLTNPYDCYCEGTSLCQGICDVEEEEE